MDMATISFGQVMIRGKVEGEDLPRTMASMMEGWSEPRLTKTCETPALKRASKKAEEVVYIWGDEEEEEVGWVRGGGWEDILAVFVEGQSKLDGSGDCGGRGGRDECK